MSRRSQEGGWSELISQIGSQGDILSVISEYTSLKKSGRSYLGLCPFHADKKPSFVVDAEKQLFHCFGCGIGGNIFTFITQIEKVTFKEAVRILAEKFNLRLPNSVAPKDETEKLQIYKINTWSANLYQNYLRRTKKVLDYLKTRQISDESVRIFKLGYAPLDWHFLEKALVAEKQTFSPRDLEKAGLLISKERGYYDRFRDRLIFPIHNLRSQIIGFGGRVMNDNDEPKYLNSPETSVYKKGENLYGLSLTHREMVKAGYGFLVEGYIDLIRLFQTGIKNAVASLGTALTLTQARLIKRYVSEITVVFDGDSSGEKASLKSLEVFLEEGLEVKVMTLPSGFDPDTFLLKYGKEEFLREAEKSPSFLNYAIETVKKGENLKEISTKLKAVEKLFPLLLKIPQSLKRLECVKKVAEEFSLEERALLGELEKQKQYSKRSLEAPIELTSLREASPQKIEMELFKTLVKFPQYIPLVEKELALEEISTPELRKAFQFLFQKGKNTLDKFPPFEVNIYSLISEVELKEEKLEVTEEVIRDYIKKIRLRRSKERKRWILQEIKHAEEKGELEKVKELLYQYAKV
jgi:DNA primase